MEKSALGVKLTVHVPPSLPLIVCEPTPLADGEAALLNAVPLVEPMILDVACAASAFDMAGRNRSQPARARTAAAHRAASRMTRGFIFPPIGFWYATPL